MSPASIDDVSHKPQYAEVTPAMPAGACQALYNNKVTLMPNESSGKLSYEPQFVDVTASTYLVITQDVLAETPQAMKVVRTLYEIEAELRKTGGHNNEPLPYTEGVWRLLNPQKGFKDHLNIQGRFMLRQKYSVNPEELEQAKQQLAKQYSTDEELLALLPHVYLEEQKEGPSICMLHVGPYSEEGKSFELMTNFARSLGLRKQGEFHREIYLRDAQTEQDAKKFHTILYLFVTKI